MNKSQYQTHGFFYKLLLRWVICTLGLWIAAGLIGGVELEDGFAALVLAGLVLALVNSFIKPLAMLLAFPAIMLTLGLFIIVINGLMVMLAGAISGALEVSSVWSAMLAGIVIGLVNYLVTAIVENKR